MPANPPNGANLNKSPLILTLTVEGNPEQLCRRTVYGSIDRLVFFELQLRTIAQKNIVGFLRQVANEFAAQESAIVAPVN